MLRQAKTTNVGYLMQEVLLEGHESSYAVQVMANKGKDAATQLEAALLDSEGLELLRIGSHLLTRPTTSNWSRSSQLPSGGVLNLGPKAMAMAQIMSKVKVHYGEVRAWPPGTGDYWYPLDVHCKMDGNVKAIETACGVCNAMVAVKARKEHRQQYDWDDDIVGDSRGDDPVFDSAQELIDDCKPDLNHAITTLIVRDRDFVQDLGHRWCVRDGQGITLAELLLQFKDSHTYEQLYFSWLSCKLLMRRRLGWGTPVLFPSHVACCTASLTWSELHFSQFLDIQVSVALMWR